MTQLKGLYWLLPLVHFLGISTQMRRAILLDGSRLFMAPMKKRHASLGIMSDKATIEGRIERLEAAVVSLARLEFGGQGSGENPGHSFNGNQYVADPSGSKVEHAPKHSPSNSAHGHPTAKKKTGHHGGGGSGHATGGSARGGGGGGGGGSGGGGFGKGSAAKGGAKGGAHKGGAAAKKSGHQGGAHKGTGAKKVAASKKVAAPKPIKAAKATAPKKVAISKPPKVVVLKGSKGTVGKHVART